MSNEGDKYGKKFLLNLNEGWSFDGVINLVDSMGFEFRSSSRANERNFNMKSDEGNFYFVLYSSNEMDSETEVRHTYVNESGVQWYKERGWVELPMGKMEAPY
ncbi:MAG: hypothetical protein ACRC6V_09335 [Bacteroidales bacterium]